MGIRVCPVHPRWQGQIPPRCAAAPVVFLDQQPLLQAVGRMCSARPVCLVDVGPSVRSATTVLPRKVERCVPRFGTMKPGSSCFLLREGIMLHFTTSEVLRVLLE